MHTLSYEINKGVNRSIEFRGLKAQYIYYLAIGLAVLLIIFSVLYITGIPVYICLPLVAGAGTLLFMATYKYSHRYGEFGLMKAMAFKRVPRAITSKSARLFRDLGQAAEKEGAK